MNATEALKRIRKFLEDAGIENPGKEAELIVSHCLGKDRLVLYRDNPMIPEDVNIRINEFSERRIKREPLQYIIGYTEFHGLKIKVGQGVLIPRPETELLAEEAIKVLRGQKLPHHPPLNKGGQRGGRTSSFIPSSSFNILDLCTGTGCIALSLAKEFPDAFVYGADISELAITYAKQNMELNGINNVAFLKGNLFEPVEKNLRSQNSNLKFALIVSNPPYIKSGDIKNLQPEIKDWEPVEALSGGEEGLDYYRKIIPESKNYLDDCGHLMLELGIDQSVALKHIAEDAGFRNTIFVKDYAGIERIMIIKKEQ